jgi:hypothetical protein
VRRLQQLLLLQADCTRSEASDEGAEKDSQVNHEPQGSAESMWITAVRAVGAATRSCADHCSPSKLITCAWPWLQRRAS